MKIFNVFIDSRKFKRNKNAGKLKLILKNNLNKKYSDSAILLFHLRCNRYIERKIRTSL